MPRVANSPQADPPQLIWDGSSFACGGSLILHGNECVPVGDFSGAVAYDPHRGCFLIGHVGGWKVVSVSQAEAWLREKAAAHFTTGPPDACLVFVADDGAMADYDKLGPLARDGVPFTLALTRDYLTGGKRADMMSPAEANEMVSWGCEIAAHGLTHRPLHKLDDAEMRGEIDGSIDYLRQFGWQVSSFVYPYGACNTNARQHLWRMNLIGCKAHGGAALAGFDRTAIPRIALGSFPRPGLRTVAQYTALIDQVFRARGLLVFMLHPGEDEHDEVQQQTLIEVVRHARDIGMRITTLSEGAMRHGPLWQERPGCLRQWELSRDGRFIRRWTGGSPADALWSWLSSDSSLRNYVWKGRGYLRRALGRNGSGSGKS